MLDRRRSAAESYLVTTKKETKSVSALNILFRREMLEKHQIRFEERFLLYADLTFVVQAVYYAKRFDRDLKALYVKRKHNDPIHQPSISQTKLPTRFQEHMDAYKTAASLVPVDSSLRKILDRKMIYYFTGDFARRMKRSKDETYRTERFELVRSLVNDMNPDVLKAQKGYKKRFLKQVRKGNVKGAVSVVKRRLAWKKFKSITSNKKTFAKFLYIHWFVRRPVKKNWVLFESFFGKNYSDSPKYIYEYLAKNYGDKYKFIWVIDKKGTKIPYKHKKIKRYGILYSYYMARCGYFVLNTRQPSWYIKRKDTVFLETWHGTPLKKLVFDQEEVTAASPLYKEQFYRQDKKWDYLVAANQFSSETFRRCFMYPNEMLEYGYPRNDIMHHPEKERIAADLRRKLGIPEGKKTILYAPTWRDDEFYGSGQYKFTLKLDLQKMKEALGNEYVILLRTHYYIADSLDVTGVEDFAMNFSKYDDISELYLISDICITDYSSVFFDYANLRRPMLFFTYDLDKYRDVLRGFYIDMLTEVPGPLLFTTEEVIDAVKNIEDVKKKYAHRYDEFYERFCAWEDGHAAENCVKKVFELN
jgi:CDP-glycerol glycerophosphotransferase